MANTFKGWNVDIIKKKETGGATLPSQTVGFAQSMSVSVAANAEAVSGVGHAFPVEIKDGPFEISGSVEKMYGDARLWDATTTQGTYFQIIAQMASGDTITTKGVKFDSWDVDIPQDDFLTESADFLATAITVAGSTAYTGQALSASSVPAASTEEIDQTFSCDEIGCDFEAKSERGLEIHKGRVHEGD